MCVYICNKYRCFFNNIWWNMYIYQNTPKCTKRWKQSAGIKQLLENLIFRHKDVHWLYHRCYME